METQEDTQGVMAHVKCEMDRGKQCSDMVRDIFMVPRAVVALHDLAADVPVHHARASKDTDGPNIRLPPRPYKSSSLPHKRLRRIPFLANADLDYIIARSKYLKAIWRADEPSETIALQCRSRAADTQRCGMKRKAVHIAEADDADDMGAIQSPAYYQSIDHKNKKARIADSLDVRQLSHKLSRMSFDSQ